MQMKLVKENVFILSLRGFCILYVYLFLEKVLPWAAVIVAAEVGAGGDACG